MVVVLARTTTLPAMHTHELVFVTSFSLKLAFCIQPFCHIRRQAQATRFGVFNIIPAESRNTPAKAALSGAFAGGVSVLLFQGIDVGKYPSRRYVTQCARGL